MRDESPNASGGGPEPLATAHVGGGVEPESTHSTPASWSRACHNRSVNRNVDPPSLAPTAANYAQAMLSVGSTKMLHTSGIVPIDVHGNVPASLEEQVATVWANIMAILAEARMVVEDIVSITTYVVVGEDLSLVMAARDRALGGHLTASTLVTVPALARPEWRMEISLVAAS